MTRIVIISDLHYERRVFRGVDESRAWEWLLLIVDYHKPDLLLSCGDWGTAVNEAEFYELLRRTLVLTIYGNHENMDVLVKLRNVKSRTCLPVLMEDGRVYEFNGLRIAGISGIIALKKKIRKGVPRRTPEEFLEVAEKLRGKDVDILLMHETPYLPKLFPFMRDSLSSRTALKVVEIIKPKLVINGHMHYGGYSNHDFSFGTKYIYIDSSQQNRHYAVLDINSKELEIWHDLKPTHELPL